MLEMQVRHTYVAGRATDVSGNGNHGIPTSTQASTIDGTSSLFFNGVGARVEIRPGEDFTEMRGFRVRIRVKLNVFWWWWLLWPWLWWQRWWARWPWVPLARWWPWRFRRRHNLVEGHLSFALFIQRDLSIRGTIRGPNGQWDGPVSPAGAIRPKRWHTIEYGHDGISRAVIAVDGITVADTRQLPGPIADVGPNGVVVGHWPEPDHRYTFRGWIDDVEIWTDRPDREQVDPCCGDSDLVDDTVDALIEDENSNWDPASARALMMKIEKLETEIRMAVVGNDSAVAAQLDALAVSGGAAISSGDKVAGMSALAGTLQLAGNRLSASDLESLLTRAGAIGHELPLHETLLAVAGGDEDARRALSRLTAALCLPGVRIPDGERAKSDRRDPKVSVGDPYTDAEDAGSPPGAPLDALLRSEPARPHDDEPDC